MVSKLPIIWKQTVGELEDTQVSAVRERTGSMAAPMAVIRAAAASTAAASTALRQTVGLSAQRVGRTFPLTANVKNRKLSALIIAGYCGRAATEESLDSSGMGANRLSSAAYSPLPSTSTPVHRGSHTAGSPHSLSP